MLTYQKAKERFFKQDLVLVAIYLSGIFIAMSMINKESPIPQTAYMTQSEILATNLLGLMFLIGLIWLGYGFGKLMEVRTHYKELKRL